MLTVTNRFAMIVAAILVAQAAAVDANPGAASQAPVKSVNEDLDIYQLARECRWNDLRAGVDRYLISHPQDGDALMLKMAVADHAGDKTQVIAIATKLIAMKQHFMDAYEWRARTYMAQNKIEQAIKDYKEALKVDTGHRLRYDQLADAYDAAGRQDLASEQRRQGVIVDQLRNAWNHLGECANPAHPAEQKSADYAADYLAGQDAFGRNDYRAAIEYMSRALRVNADLRAAYLYRGAARESLDEWKEAIKNFTALIASGDKYVSVKIAPAASMQKQRFDGWPAIAFPMAEVYRCRARCYLSMGQVDKAIADGAVLVKEEPDEKSAFELFGDIYSTAKMCPQAIEQYKKAEQVQYTEKEVGYKIATCYRGMGDWKHAIERLNWLIRLVPADAALHEQRADALSRVGRHAEAIADLTQVIENDPDARNAYLHRGEEFEAVSDLKKALADYNKALAIEPHSKAVYEDRARLYYKLARPDLAARDKSRAQSIAGP